MLEIIKKRSVVYTTIADRHTTHRAPTSGRSNHYEYRCRRATEINRYLSLGLCMNHRQCGRVGRAFGLHVHRKPTKRILRFVRPAAATRPYVPSFTATYNDRKLQSRLSNVWCCTYYVIHIMVRCRGVPLRLFPDPFGTDFANNDCLKSINLAVRHLETEACLYVCSMIYIL